MSNFSRYIKPGYRLVPVDDPDTVGALSPDKRTLVLVHVNGGIMPRHLTVAGGDWSVRSMILTDAEHRAEAMPRQANAAIIAPPRSVTTWLVSLN
jgi:hypothetical protein